MTPANAADASPQGGKAPLEYSALVASPLVNGEAKLSLVENGLHIMTTLDALELGFVEMLALSIANYTVGIRTPSGDFTFSRMGTWCEPFYNALFGAYQEKTLAALFEGRQLVLATTGDYRYMEGGVQHAGHAAIQVHEDCLCILPPNVDARRVPLCFVTGIEKQGFEVTLTLDNGDAYACSKLGYDTDPFVNALEAQLRALRERTLATTMELDPQLSSMQSFAIAKLVPEGAAASLGQLGQIAPSFVAAVEARIAASRARDTYEEFKALAGRDNIYVGFKKGQTFEGRGGSGDDGAAASGGDGSGAASMLQGLGGLAGSAASVSDAASPTGENAQDAYLIWLIAPSPKGSVCAVEFAGGAADTAATFVYRFNGSFEHFASQLNHALEAIDFRREVIRMDDSDLTNPANATYLMAVQRNAALQFVRTSLAGRIIHSSLETWKQQLEASF